MMRTRLWIALGLLALVPGGRAEAQGKFVGKMTCAKPDQNHVAPVGDSPDHVIMLITQKCTWSQGDINGDKLKDESDTFTSDASGNESHDRGYGVGTLASGDKYFVEFKGTTALKDQKPVSGECKWKFTGGTGKAKGIDGKGTCKGTFTPDGGSSFEMEGEYKTK
ncbi:MAG TPA: hypothetical protein VIG08_11550 [Gemmatimonadales bacterium]